MGDGQMDLKQEVLKDRWRSYLQVSGGYTFPLAGATYWAALAFYGVTADLQAWNFAALITSGAIFPLAVLYSKLCGVDFFNNPSSVDTSLGPAFTGMLLFYAILIPLYSQFPEAVPLVLAIGMSMHWPIIGWSYGRSFLYSVHAVVRALAVMFIWALMPDDRLTLLPLAVTAAYLMTVVWIWIDLPITRRRLAAIG
jgi:hypothetical protein